MACEAPGQEPHLQECQSVPACSLENLQVLQVSWTSATVSQGYSLVLTYKMFEKSDFIIIIIYFI